MMWTTREGVSLLISEMETSHIVNTIKMLERTHVMSGKWASHSGKKKPNNLLVKKYKKLKQQLVLRKILEETARIYRQKNINILEFV